MPKRPRQTTEILRVPRDLAAVIRRRAVTQDVTMAQAVRDLLGRGRAEGEAPLGLEDHVHWLAERLDLKRRDVERLFRREGVDPAIVGRAIQALREVDGAWARMGLGGDDASDDDDQTVYQPQQ